MIVLFAYGAVHNARYYGMVWTIFLYNLWLTSVGYIHRFDQDPHLSSAVDEYAGRAFGHVRMGGGSLPHAAIAACRLFSPPPLYPISPNPLPTLYLPLNSDSISHVKWTPIVPSSDPHPVALSWSGNLTAECFLVYRAALGVVHGWNGCKSGWAPQSMVNEGEGEEEEIKDDEVEDTDEL
jgi:hypothetical protein